MMLNSRIDVEEMKLSEDLNYKDNIIMSYSIEYPKFTYNGHKLVLDEINLHYEKIALDFQQFCKNTLFNYAKEYCDFALQNGYTITKFEGIINYSLTYNKNSILSLYFDKYQYTGGAHGGIFRYSDTWDIKQGTKMTIKDVFPFEHNAKGKIINSIYEQIEKNHDQYVEDYEIQVIKKFNHNNFYLTSNFFIVYFQEYDIAPYSSGIPEFRIAYKKV